MEMFWLDNGNGLVLVKQTMFWVDVENSLFWFRTYSGVANNVLAGCCKCSGLILENVQQEMFWFYKMNYGLLQEMF